MNQYIGRAARPVVALLLLAAVDALAQAAYPARPVRMILPFPPGGGTDITGRIVAQKLAELWTVGVPVDNRPGAGSVIGTDLVAKAVPDGYTLGVTSMAHPINATLYRALPYDSIRDFEFIMLTVRVPNVLVVHPSVPAKSVRDLIALAKSQPGRLDFSSSGVGGASHLAAEVFGATSGIRIVHIPYKGAAAAMVGLLGGEVHLMMATVPVMLPHIKSGRVRPLAMSSLKRSPLMPELPTIAESGYPGFETDSWFGLFAPAGTPQEILKKVHADTARALASGDVKAALAQQGAQPGGGSSQEFLEFVRAEIAKWRKAILDAKVSFAN